MSMDPPELSYPAVDVNARIRIIENKYNLLGERILIMNKNMIEEYKKLIKHVRAIDSELKELKHDIFVLRDAVKRISEELDGFAKKQDLKVVEKYINLWNPVNFVTEEEVKKIIKRVKDDSA